MTSTISRTGHTVLDAHPIAASAGTYLPDDPAVPAAHERYVVGEPKQLSGRRRPDAHSAIAVEPPTPQSTMQRPQPISCASTGDLDSDGQTSPDTQSVRAVAPTPPGRARRAPMPTVVAPVLADPLLSMAAEVLDDIETMRKANENRLRQLTRPRGEIDKDGRSRGFGLTLHDDAVKSMAETVGAMYCQSNVLRELGLPKIRRRSGCCMECDAIRNLERLIRKHPLGPWVKTLRGVGDKQLGRLLGAIGDPYIRPEMVSPDGIVEPSRPRTVSELWSLCGYDPKQRRRKGQKSNWSADAKMRAFNVAESTFKQLISPCHSVKDDKGAYLAGIHVSGCQCSPYRVLYDEGRVKYHETLHPEDCAQCGPRGKPAPKGSVRSAKHQHQMAIRRVTKEILKNLWQEARRLHEPPGATQAVMPTVPAPQGPHMIN